MNAIASYRSPPLSKIITQINKRSQNLYAELLFLTLGAVQASRGSALNAAHVVKETITAMGVKTDTLAIYDGSGLSRLNLVSPSQMVQILDHMSRQPVFPYFYRSLPVAGVDGTLSKRMKNPETKNNVRAKTGTMTHEVALSGYMTTSAGEKLAFSIMSNNCPEPAWTTRLLQDRICNTMVRFDKEE